MGVGVPYIPLTTGDFGCNDFSFDFGFFHCSVVDSLFGKMNFY